MVWMRAENPQSETVSPPEDETAKYREFCAHRRANVAGGWLSRLKHRPIGATRMLARNVSYDFFSLSGAPTKTM